jgi:hypothetical protein
MFMGYQTALSYEYNTPHPSRRHLCRPIPGDISTHLSSLQCLETEHVSSGDAVRNNVTASIPVFIPVSFTEDTVRIFVGRPFAPAEVFFVVFLNSPSK